jgi:hypothetical protein
MSYEGRQSVRVIGHDCEECFAALAADCAEIGFPQIGKFAVVPVSWLQAVCPHGRRGVQLESIQPDDNAGSSEAAQDEPGRSTATLEDQKPFKQSRWRELFPDTKDASKGIGYPAREHGWYGSYPQNDGSEDE